MFRKAPIPVILAAVAAPALLAQGCTSGPASAPAGSDPIAALQFMTGQWQSSSEGTVTTERWAPAEGGLMLGTAITVKDGKAVFFEFLRVEQRGKSLVYVAQPKGNPPTDFTMTESSADSVTFTNPTHDFPKRIRYERKGDRLLATVDSGPNNGAGSPPAQTFLMQRVTQ